MWPRSTIANVLALICNLAMHDKVAQTLALYEADNGLIPALFEILLSPDSTPLTTIGSPFASRTSISVTPADDGTLHPPTLTSHHELLPKPAVLREAATPQPPAKPRRPTAHEPADLRLACLECLRNLCVDDTTCVRIVRLGSHHLLRLLFTNPSSSDRHRETLALLRNLVVQNAYCAEKLVGQEEPDYLMVGASSADSGGSAGGGKKKRSLWGATGLANTGFVAEVIAGLASKDTTGVQRCAVDIVTRLLELGGDEARAMLVEEGCLQALVIAMDQANSGASNAAAAAKCYKELKMFEDRSATGFRDHWARIKREWDDADRNAALELRKLLMMEREAKRAEMETGRIERMETSHVENAPRRQPTPKKKKKITKRGGFKKR
ncbi:hypothetical protein HK101_008220 [Irineochytrium annulatum]|nr:hypothetical protein HK101_008220 [Irineochytrium annulatum]